MHFFWWFLALSTTIKSLIIILYQYLPNSDDDDDITSNQNGIMEHFHRIEFKHNIELDFSRFNQKSKHHFTTNLNYHIVQFKRSHLFGSCLHFKLTLLLPFLIFLIRPTNKTICIKFKHQNEFYSHFIHWH